MTTYGSKYHETKDLDVADVARLVRADIKVGVHLGALPAALGYRVRIERYSMGQAINVTVTGLTDVQHFTTNGYGRMVLSRGAQQIEDTLKAVLAAYNRDNSDGAADYYEVRFAAEVDVQTEEDAAAEAAHRDRQATRRARRAQRAAAR